MSEENTNQIDKELRSVTPRAPLSPPDILEIFYELWKIFVQLSRDIERAECSTLECKHNLQSETRGGEC